MGLTRLRHEIVQAREVVDPADLFDLPRPPRLPRAMAAAHLPLGLLSFMGESRRMDNTRLKRELKLVLRYPTVTQGLQPA